MLKLATVGRRVLVPFGPTIILYSRRFKNEVFKNNEVFA